MMIISIKNSLIIMRLIISIALILTLPLHLINQIPEFPVFAPELAGTLRFGLINDAESIWLNNCKEVQIKNKDSVTIYHLRHKWLNKGDISFFVRKLNDTQGFIIKIVANDIPDNIRLFWAFGGCSGEEITPDKNKTLLKPEHCKDNVFSVEGNSFTIYYGTSRKLRILEALVPPGSDILLSDAHQQKTPLAFFNSGKNTDAPALSAITQLKNDDPIYFCFYKQNPKSDYNYFMLPELFKTGSYEVHSESQWMKSTPD